MKPRAPWTPEVRAKIMRAAREKRELVDAIVTYVNGLADHVAFRSGAGMAFSTYVRKDKSMGRHVQRFGPPGMPDVSGYRNIQKQTGFNVGQALYFEVKKPGKKPRPAQVKFMDRAREHGCLAEPVWSVEDVQRILGMEDKNVER